MGTFTTPMKYFVNNNILNLFSNISNNVGKLLSVVSLVKLIIISSTLILIMS